MTLMKTVGPDQAGNMTEAEQVLEYRRGDFLISTDRSRLDLDVVHGFLTECYWARGIAKEVVARSIQHSLCFGMYHAEKQAGFARVISDLQLMLISVICLYWNRTVVTTWASG